jgi:hypothetical protein
LNRSLSAGSIVETKCTRCRTVMNHTIVAMVGEKIVRVECNTCHGTHAFHPLKVPKEPVAAKTAQKKPAAAPRKSRVDPEAADREEWATNQPGMDPERAIPYDMNRAYRVNALLSHPTFGFGIVKAVLPPNKIAVLFKEGRKLLRCG